MTLQDAYNKGLDDAEAQVIKKLLAVLDGGDDGNFANPEMEAIRQRVVELRNNTTQSVEIKNKKRILDGLEKALSGKAYKRRVPDDDFEDFRNRLTNIIVAVYTKPRKHTQFSRHMKKILRENAKKVLTSDDDVVN